MVRWKGVIWRGKDTEGKASNAFDVEIDIEELGEGYHLRSSPKSATSEGGLLCIAALTPTTPSLPSFTLRWDQKDNHLNVDIGRVAERERGWFKKGQNGYGGHTFERSFKDGKSFDVEIAIPSMTVFRGRVTFNLALEDACMARMKLSAECEITVFRATKGQGTDG